jgi:hypothetical protein
MRADRLGKEIQADERGQAALGERRQGVERAREIHRRAETRPDNSAVERIIVDGARTRAAVEGVKESHAPEGRWRCRHVVEQALQRRLQQPIDVVLPHYVELADAHGSARSGGSLRRRGIDDPHCKRYRPGCSTLGCGGRRADQRGRRCKSRDETSTRRLRHEHPAMRLISVSLATTASLRAFSGKVDFRFSAENAIRQRANGPAYSKGGSIFAGSKRH